MDLGFSKSEKLLIDSAREFLEKEAVDVARQCEQTDEGYSPELWKKMAELGWMGIMVPEEYGGSSGSFLELTLLLEELGRALVPGPFISTVCLGLSIFKYGTEAQKYELLPKLAEGELILTPAFIAPSSTAAEDKVVDLEDGSYLLSGIRLFSPYAHLANWIVYKAKIDKRETLFLISTMSSGIHCNILKTIAPDSQCEIILNEVRVLKTNILGQTEEGNKVTNEIEEWGALCQSAFILGILEKVLDMTVKHAKKREQFERKIGNFQAIQHQCADMVTETDKVRFLTYQAAWKLGEKMRPTKEISMAKALASDVSRSVCLLGIKIHGGIGISEEYDLQLYFRMAKNAEIAFGDGDFHREIIAQQLGL